MRIWVSGAGGNLGSEVCRQLAVDGHEVIEADLTGPRIPESGGDSSGLGQELVGGDLLFHVSAPHKVVKPPAPDQHADQTGHMAGNQRGNPEP